MCNTGNLCDYSAVGGKWQRTDPACGRVGSVLSDPGAYSVGTTVRVPGYDELDPTGNANRLEQEDEMDSEDEPPLPSEEDLKALTEENRKPDN